MKSNELMIGDWVFIKDYPIKALPQKVKPEHFVRSLVEFEPIPITPDILEKNGFEKSYSSILTAEGFKKLPVYKYKNMKQAHDVCHNLIKVCVSLDGSKYDVEFGIGSHIFDLEFVHQLQHALRLCGIEKEIKL